MHSWRHGHGPPSSCQVSRSITPQCLLLCALKWGVWGKGEGSPIFPASFPGHRVMVVYMCGREVWEEKGPDSGRGNFLNEVQRAERSSPILHVQTRGLGCWMGKVASTRWPLRVALPPLSTSRTVPAFRRSWPFLNVLPLFPNPLGDLHDLLRFGFPKQKTGA